MAIDAIEVNRFGHKNEERENRLLWHICFLLSMFIYSYTNWRLF